MIGAVGLAQHFAIEHHGGVGSDDDAQANGVFRQDVLDDGTGLALGQLLYRLDGLRALVGIKRFVHFGRTGAHRELHARIFKKLLAARAVRGQDDVYGNGGCIRHGGFLY